jgi:ring-1,2-phenylacetyl-CoA epoxidase subunit PaaD
MDKITEKKIWELLDKVKDPEIQVVSLVEMGIVRDVKVEGDVVQVSIAPTFSGCPALQVMREEAISRFKEAGIFKATVTLNLSMPWSSDRITPEGRRKLKEFGLAPPAMHAGKIQEALLLPVTCPRCGSQDTSLKNSFGPTLCRALFVCNACGEPFEQFKPI